MFFTSLPEPLSSGFINCDISNMLHPEKKKNTALSFFISQQPDNSTVKQRKISDSAQALSL